VKEWSRVKSRTRSLGHRGRHRRPDPGVNTTRNDLYYGRSSPDGTPPRWQTAAAISCFSNGVATESTHPGRCREEQRTCASGSGSTLARSPSPKRLPSASRGRSPAPGGEANTRGPGAIVLEVGPGQKARSDLTRRDHPRRPATSLFFFFFSFMQRPRTSPSGLRGRPNHCLEDPARPALGGWPLLVGRHGCRSRRVIRYLRDAPPAAPRTGAHDPQAGQSRGTG